MTVLAAGLLLLDDAGNPMLVRPTYKEHWEIPGGVVEAGESPRAACAREIEEELGLTLPIGQLLVVDWAPRDGQDRLLFIFDGGTLAADSRAAIAFADGEISEYGFVPPGELDGYLPGRLARRVRLALAAAGTGIPRYAEHGLAPFAN